MDPLGKLSLPFLTRKMLAFEHATTFKLKVSAISSVAANIRIRGFTSEGPFTFRHVTVSDSILEEETFALPDIPISIAAFDTAGSLIQGECFMALKLQINGDDYMQLCAGYVYDPKGLTWPAPYMTDLIPGRGRIGNRTAADPAAGDEISIAVTDGQIWHVLGLSFTLVAAAAAASRRVHVVFSDGQGTTIDTFATTDQIISETKKYSVAHFGATPDETDDNDILINMPSDIWLRTGGSIDTVTTNLNAGDNFSAPDLIIEEFFQFPP